MLTFGKPMEDHRKISLYSMAGTPPESRRWAPAGHRGDLVRTEADPSPGTYRLRVQAIAWEAEGISSFELRDPSGHELPRFAAGAHIDIHVRADCVRQYSLCNDPSERHR